MRIGKTARYRVFCGMLGLATLLGICNVVYRIQAMQEVEYQLKVTQHVSYISGEELAHFATYALADDQTDVAWVLALVLAGITLLAIAYLYTKGSDEQDVFLVFGCILLLIGVVYALICCSSLILSYAFSAPGTWVLWVLGVLAFAAAGYYDNHRRNPKL
jgi:hypothetical protein